MYVTYTPNVWQPGYSTVLYRFLRSTLKYCIYIPNVYTSMYSTLRLHTRTYVRPTYRELGTVPSPKEKKTVTFTVHTGICFVWKIQIL